MQSNRRVSPSVHHQRPLSQIGEESGRHSFDRECAGGRSYETGSRTRVEVSIDALVMALIGIVGHRVSGGDV